MPTGLRDAPQLVVDVLDHATALLRAELKLARAELTEGIEQAGKGLGWYLAAAMLGLTALHGLGASAALTLIAMGMTPPLAVLTTVGIALILAAICATIARRRIRRARAMPDRTLRRLEQDAKTLGDINHA